MQNDLKKSPYKEKNIFKVVRHCLFDRKKITTLVTASTLAKVA